MPIAGFVMESIRSYANWFWLVGSIRYGFLSSAAEYARWSKSDKYQVDSVQFAVLGDERNAVVHGGRSLTQNRRTVALLCDAHKS
jgi:hypothetical protein